MHLKVSIKQTKQTELDHVSCQKQTKYRENEPRHDKTKKMSVRPAKTLIRLGIRPV